MTDLLIEMCQKYRKLLDSPPNGLGQHVHPTFVQSDWMLRSMNAEFGEGAVRTELDKQFNQNPELEEDGTLNVNTDDDQQEGV